MTTEQLAALASWPFPPEDGYIYDHDSLAHWLEATTESVSADSTFSRSKGGGDLRLHFLALATTVEIGQAISLGGIADRATENAEAIRAESRSALNVFVDGLIAEPAVVSTSLPAFGTVIVVGPTVIVFHIPPVNPPVNPPDPPDPWVLSAIDLVAVAGKLQSASMLSGVGDSSADLSAAAGRLLEVAKTR